VASFWERKSASMPDYFIRCPSPAGGGLAKAALSPLCGQQFLSHMQFTRLQLRHYTQGVRYDITLLGTGGMRMPNGTLDLMKLDGQPVTYQIMFEQNAGGTFVARVESDELVPFLHEEMRVDMPIAESAAQRLNKESRVRLPNIFLEENNLHAVMDYMEEDI
jgi:hypothetical protein